MKYEIYVMYFQTRQAFYHALPLKFIVKKYKKLAALENAMLRHPSKVKADTYDKVADHVSSLGQVIDYRVNNPWTKKDVKTLFNRVSVFFLIFLIMGIVGGME